MKIHFTPVKSKQHSSTEVNAAIWSLRLLHYSFSVTLIVNHQNEHSVVGASLNDFTVLYI